MKIPGHIIEQVRANADILEVVQDYVRMKKAGSNYIGLCPFHDEKTASFNVNPSKGGFKCFGCGKGGDTIAFVMEIERIEFPDAVRWLANRMGIPIPVQRGDQEESGEKETVYNALLFASDYFTQKLRDPVLGNQAREYLRGRGLTDKTIERFKLGYAPDSWDGLLKEAQINNIKPEVLQRAGLIIGRDGGGHYDRFRNRVIFPVWSHIGKIIGFGGRAMAEDPKVPKYLNSPETEVYRKSFVLYGLSQAKREARQHEKILLVEGYTDVLALDQAGIGSVACCGTALTPEQVRLLGRFVKEIQLLYDADTAGAAATERAIDCVLQNGLTANVVTLPEGEDPDSFVRQQGSDKFKAYLQDETRDWLKFLFESAEQNNLLGTPQGRRKEISRLTERIAWLRDPLLQKLYIRDASALFNVQEGDIKQEILRYLRRQQMSVQPTPAQPERSPVIDEIPEAEKILLQLMLENGPFMIQFVLGALSVDIFQKGPSQELVKGLMDLYHNSDPESSDPVDVGQLQISPQGHELAYDLLIEQHEISDRWIDKKITVPERNQDAMRIAKDCMAKIQIALMERDIEELTRKIIRSGDGSGDQYRLQGEFQQMRMDLSKLKKKRGRAFDD